MCAGLLLSLMLVAAPDAFAKTATVTGAVRDETGRALPGVSVELRVAGGAALTAVSDGQGRYRIDRVTPGRYQIVFTLINFATSRRDVDVPAGRDPGARRRAAPGPERRRDGDRQATPSRTWPTSSDPAENLVGIAQSASQGAITARQLDARPIMRAGEVLETVPGRRHQPAQRRGQGQPVLPARLQPRSRHRLRDDAWPACRSTCRRTGTARAIPISTS